MGVGGAKTWGFAGRLHHGRLARDATAHEAAQGCARSRERAHLSVSAVCAVGSPAHASAARAHRNLARCPCGRSWRAARCRRIAELNKSPVEGFSAGLVDESNPFDWDICIMGPPDTP